jgi:hypothetical protein
MNNDPRDLIDGYLDDLLSPEQHAILNDWIKSEPEHAQVFVQASLLHDRLQSSTVGYGEAVGSAKPTQAIGRLSSFYSYPSLWGTAASVAILCLGLGLLWLSFGQSTASAAFRELDRMIVNSIRSKDRTYAIVVEEVFASTSRSKGRPSLESQRPPKPPLDGALLHVRDNNQFVLIRKTDDGLPFITGSNGKQSWAVKPSGPVRVSPDIQHFNHDLPGHESSIPLTNIHEGLERLKQAYHIQLSTLGPEEYEIQRDETVRLMVAVKKPRERGPQRVEIAYESKTGRILHMRFVQMPYGPDRLDLRLTLVDEKELPTDFFEHNNHHSLDRIIEMEK